MTSVLQGKPAFIPTKAAEFREGKLQEYKGWNDLLKATKVSDIVKQGQKLVTLAPDMTLSTVLQVLKDNNILGAPVILGEDKSSVLGFLDVLDISAYALLMWKQHRMSEDKLQFSDIPSATKFFETPAKDIMNFSRKDSQGYISASANVADLLNVFHRHIFKTHRVGLLNDRSEVQNMISMSDIIAWASKNLEKFPLANSTIADLKLMRGCVMTRFDTSYADALTILAENRVSALGLVDWETKLVGCFSAGDLRGLLPVSFDLFETSTLDFLRQFSSVKSKIPPVCVTVNASLRDVIQMLVNEKVHRVFVVDEKERPIGVVSVSDIIVLLSNGLQFEKTEIPTK